MRVNIWNTHICELRMEYEMMTTITVNDIDSKQLIKDQPEKTQA